MSSSSPGIAALACVCCLVSLIPLSGATIRVPADYPTIQAGLNAAMTGDTVLVAANTYSENLVWPSRNGICLFSEDGAASTVIDGGSSDRVIYFPSFAYSRSTVVSGFTITNGYAVQGGGIYIYQGSPCIYKNVIRRNVAEGTSTWVYGGGVFCDRAGSPLIVENTIQGNVAKGEYWNYGGGIYVDGQNSAEVLRNIIESDSVIGGHWNYGAGIYCDNGSTPDIRHNVILENVATQGARGYGAGIYVGRDANAYVLSNLVYRNTAQSGTWNYGAGIMINSSAEIINNTIVENRCLGGSSNAGGGIRIYDSTNTVANNIICSNSANSGGGIYASAGDHALLLNNDVWNNTGGNYAGIAPGAADISVDPLFVAGPLGDFYLSQIAAGQGSDSPCIDYGYTTAANLELHTYTTRIDSVTDAGIVDLGYHYPVDSFILGTAEITAFSAIPTGNYVLLRWRTEMEWGTLRWCIQKKPHRGTYQIIRTMESQGNASGPFTYTFSDSNITAGERYWYRLLRIDRNGHTTSYGPLMVDLTVGSVLPPTLSLSSGFPNPFHATTRFTLQIPLNCRGERIHICVYDRCGRMVRTLFSGELNPGSHAMTWDGRNSNGRKMPNSAYFLVMTSRERRITRKLIVLR